VLLCVLGGLCAAFPSHPDTRHNQKVIVRKVRAAAEWIIEHDHVAGVESATAYGAATDIAWNQGDRHVIAMAWTCPGGIKQAQGKSRRSLMLGENEVRRR